MRKNSLCAYLNSDVCVNTQKHLSQIQLTKMSYLPTESVRTYIFLKTQASYSQTVFLRLNTHQRLSLKHFIWHSVWCSFDDIRHVSYKDVQPSNLLIYQNECFIAFIKIPYIP